MTLINLRGNLYPASPICDPRADPRGKNNDAGYNSTPDLVYTQLWRAGSNNGVKIFEPDIEQLSAARWKTGGQTAIISRLL
jgi:hypothetical protein